MSLLSKSPLPPQPTDYSPPSHLSSSDTSAVTAVLYIKRCIASKTFLKENPTKELLRNQASSFHLWGNPNKEINRKDTQGAQLILVKWPVYIKCISTLFLHLKCLSKMIYWTSIKWQTIFLVEEDHLNWGGNAFLICSLFRKSIKYTLKGIL